MSHGDLADGVDYAIGAELVPLICNFKVTIVKAEPGIWVRDGQFRLFIFSREETRIRVHVADVDGEARFRLAPQVILANHTGLSAAQIRQAQVVVNAHLKEIQDAWNHHFGG